MAADVVELKGELADLRSQIAILEDQNTNRLRESHPVLLSGLQKYRFHGDAQTKRAASWNSFNVSESDRSERLLMSGTPSVSCPNIKRRHKPPFVHPQMVRLSGIAARIVSKLFRVVGPQPHTIDRMPARTCQG